MTCIYMHVIEYFKKKTTTLILKLEMAYMYEIHVHLKLEMTYNACTFIYAATQFHSSWPMIEKCTHVCVQCYQILCYVACMITTIEYTQHQSTQKRLC